MNNSILIVEDDPSIRDMLTFLLESENYQVFQASNGKEALALLSKSLSPSLILLDLMMPIMNGWQFYQSIKMVDQLKSIPIVVMSAYDPENLQVEAHLQKPSSVDDILNTVKKFIN
ncbi:MAG: response regulator [Bacteriovoracaceae bacterium]